MMAGREEEVKMPIELFIVLQKRTKIAKPRGTKTLALVWRAKCLKYGCYAQIGSFSQYHGMS